MEQYLDIAFIIQGLALLCIGIRITVPNFKSFVIMKVPVITTSVFLLWMGFYLMYIHPPIGA